MISEEQYAAAVAQKAAADQVINDYHRERADDFRARWAKFKRGEEFFSDAELLYSARTRCKQCGAGLAYPKSCGFGHQWDCSRSLNGTGPRDHESFPFAFYEIKSEDQPSAQGATTRPVAAPVPE